MTKTVTVIQLFETGHARITRLRHTNGRWSAGLSVTTDELTKFERDLILRPKILPLKTEASGERHEERKEH